MGTYSQLITNQRYHIFSLLKAGFCQTEIAEAIAVHRSTISREFKRNRGGRAYQPKQAQRFTRKRQNKAIARVESEDWKLVENLIGVDWSPE